MRQESKPNHCAINGQVSDSIQSNVPIGINIPCGILEYKNLRIITWTFPLVGILTFGDGFQLFGEHLPHECVFDIY